MKKKQVKSTNTHTHTYICANVMQMDTNRIENNSTNANHDSKIIYFDKTKAKSHELDIFHTH